MTAATSTQEDDWARLMAASQRGDRESYDRLLTQVIPVIEKFVHFRVGFVGQTSDIVQECLIAIHKSRSSFDTTKPFRPWLFAIVRYQMIAYVRRVSRRFKEQPIGNLDFAQVEVQNAEEKFHVSTFVDQILTSLPDIYSDAIRLTKIEGLSLSEAASKLKVSETALKVRCHRGMRQLAKMVEDQLRDLR